MLSLLVLLGGERALDADVESERSLLLKYVRNQRGLSGDRFLRAIRHEDVEEQVFDVQPKRPGSIAKTIRIFEVTDDGWEVISKNEALLHRSTAPLRLYVAEDVATGTFFGLGGFELGRTDFNRLAASIGVEISSPDVASAWVNFYLEVGLAQDYGFVITSARDLRRRVEDLAEAYSVSREGQLLPDAWLRNLRAHGVQPLPGIRIERGSSGFRATADMLAASGDRKRMPILSRVKFGISQAGAITELSAIELSNAGKSPASKPF
ncbi:MAG: hypothetical protein K2X03_24115 [Bryobacteraceae bacterium]|nr:hypothetical protein [Bryobacteraceae bacterium]